MLPQHSTMLHSFVVRLSIHPSDRQGQNAVDIVHSTWKLQETIHNQYILRYITKYGYTVFSLCVIIFMIRYFTYIF